MIFETREARSCALEAQPRCQGFLVFQTDAILQTQKTLMIFYHLFAILPAQAALKTKDCSTVWHYSTTTYLLNIFLFKTIA